MLNVLFAYSQDGKESQEPLLQLPLTALNLDPKGIYILDDGFNFVIWLGRMLPADLVSNILGADLAGVPDLSKV